MMISIDCWSNLEEQMSRQAGTMDVASAYLAKTKRSRELLDEARSVIPGGFSQGTRNFDSYPFHVARAVGSKLYDADGNEYSDCFLASAANLLGHAHPANVLAIQRQMPLGL